MTRRRPLSSGLLALLTTLCVLVVADQALGDSTTVVPAPSPPAAETSPETTTTVPAPSPSEPVPTGTGTTGTTTSASTGTTGTDVTGTGTGPGTGTGTANPSTAAPSTTTTATTTETTTVPAPEARKQSSQPSAVLLTHIRPSVPSKHSQAKSGEALKAHTNALPPSAVTPPLPSALGGSLLGVPSFFIDSFSIPPFLLPIYQAAGAAYGIPWQVLAAINEVETDYGRDLSVSSAGAEGWMQFLPSEWLQYGVDVTNDGFEDPFNPADAIFAAARYLKQAGGDTNIRAAVFAYNHSQTYVNSVLLRARLLGGTPPELLGAITGLTEARFPVYAASHYSDGFPATEGVSPHAVAGTTIYSQDGAPVIAVQDGRIVQISQSGPFGRTISLRDSYGNTYTYAGLGTLATLYPVLEAIESNSSADRRALSDGIGAGTSDPAASGATRKFRAGSQNVYLHPLHVGAQVIAGTVLGHVGAGVQPHVVFQIRPAGAGAPLIDPKPILDGWVKLQSSSAVKAKGLDPFAKSSPSAGQALLESKGQLERQVRADHGIRLASCERRVIADGRADRRVLAALEFLSASGFKPTVSSRSCVQAAVPGSPVSGAGAAQDAVDISAIDDIPIAGQTGSSSLAGDAVRKLASLQGVMKPLQVTNATRSGGLAHTSTPSGYAGLIHLAFTPLGGGEAQAARTTSTGLTPAQWLKLVARLGEVPDPEVSTKPSAAAIPDQSSTASPTTEGR
jgi:hypothetical protein